MNEPDLFSEDAKPANENPARPRGNSSNPVGRETRVSRSALWAAYGDALGWISELTDAAGLTRRTQGAPLDKPIAWKRRIGGRSGVTVALPRGCYSDDTQLRLATGRAIRSDGFDVEAFAKVELPLWLSYGLGRRQVHQRRCRAARPKEPGLVEQQVQGMDAFRRQRRGDARSAPRMGRADAFGSGKLPVRCSTQLGLHAFPPDGTRGRGFPRALRGACNAGGRPAVAR